MRLGCKRCILIYLGAILLMSHIIANNVSAFEYTSNVRYSGKFSGSSLYWQDNNDGNTWRNSGYKNYGRNNTHSSALYFRFSNSDRSFNASNNTIVTITGSFYSTSAVGGAYNTSGAIYVGPENLNCMIEDLDIDTVEVENVSSNEELTYYNTFVITCRTNQSTSGSIAVNLRLETLGQYGGDYTGISFSNLYYWRQDTSLYDIYTWLQNNSDDAGATLKQEKQDVQDASDNSETVADNNSENASTTNLVGALSSLLSALTNLNATNCNVTLPFPSALGGNMTVNICQNKDYAGNIISVFGSLTLCVFYVPLALKLLSMIYNEIRSFTNG